MSNGTVVIGTVFMDCKGFASYRYDPLGRNVGDVKFIHGGVGRNVAENLALIGSRPIFVSSVDNGALGSSVLARLEKEGVDVSRVRKAESSGMGIWLAIMDENGDLAASISQMPDLSIMEAIVKEEGEELVASSKSIMLELDLNDFISSETIRLAKKYKKSIYGITGNMEVILRNRWMLPELDCYICNETEAGRLLECEIPARWPEQVRSMLKDYAASNGMKAMMITLGAQGAVWYDGAAQQTGFCPAVPTKVVDTSGAGDAFFSGAIEALIRGYSIEYAAAFGARLASWTIMEEGPTCSKTPEPLF